MKRLTSLFFLALLLSVIALVSVSSKLIMVQQLFRHGARYPVYPKKDDGSGYAYKEHSFGELTTNGKKMHYLLGQKIYQTYWDQLFAGTPYHKQYNQSRFYIKSTDVNRTIESVQSHMAGILEKLPVLEITQNMTQFSNPPWSGIKKAQVGPVFPQAPAFHPIAIHVEKTGTNAMNHGDFLRTYSPENCPNQYKWQMQNQRNQLVKSIIKNQQLIKAAKALSTAMNSTIGVLDMAGYYDNYISAKHLGKQYNPIFEDTQFVSSFAYVHTMGMYISLYMQPIQIKATSTGFFNATIWNIKKVIASKQENPQWVVYSAHDTTVGNMLAAMEMTTVKCIYEAYLNNETQNTQECVSQYPAYASNLIFQVYEVDQQIGNAPRHFVKVRYNGEYRKMPFCGYNFQCPVDRFYLQIEKMLDANYLSTCGVKDTDAETYFALAVVQFAIIFSLGISALITYLKNRLPKTNKAEGKQKNSGKYNRISLDNSAAQADRNSDITHSANQEDILNSVSANKMVNQSLISGDDE